MADSGVLSLIRLFPVEFECLFVYPCDELIMPSTLLELFRFPDNMTDKEVLTAAWLRQFVQVADSDGKLYIEMLVKA